MTRLTVAICDDDKMALGVVSGAVRSAFESNGVEADIHVFPNAKKLHEAVGREEFQLIFLDIDMPGMDGIQYGKHLRRTNNATEIIYVSNCESRVFESFEVHPFGFIRKSNFLKDLSDVIRLYVAAHKNSGPSQTIDLPTHYNSRISARIENILYFEGNGIYQMLYRTDGEPVEIVSRMEQLEISLTEHGFMRIHKGYLVNYRHIVRIDVLEVTLTTGQKLPVSRRKSKEIKQQYLQLGRKYGVLMF